MLTQPVLHDNYAYIQKPSQQPKPKNEILVPRIISVEDYKNDMPPTYQVPIAYVRHHKNTPQELEDTIEYLIDAEDEVWLLNNSKFGGAAANNNDEKNKRRARKSCPDPLC